MVKASSRHCSIHLVRLLDLDHGHDPVLVLDPVLDHDLDPVLDHDLVLVPDLDPVLDHDLVLVPDLDHDLVLDQLPVLVQDLAWSKPALDITAFI